MNFYFFYLFSLIIEHAYLIVKFKFEKYPINLNNINSIQTYNYFPKTTNANNNFFYRLFTDDIHFNLTLGTPPQIIPTIWNMNQYSFKFYNKSFNINKSSSFDDAILGQDIFYFTEVNSISFNTKLNFLKFEQGEKNYSFVGLQLPDYIADDLLNFTRVLKQGKIINNYIFFIYYNIYQNNDEIVNYNGHI